MRSRSDLPESLLRGISRGRVTCTGWHISALDVGASDVRAARTAALMSGAGFYLYVLVTRKGSLTYETNRDNAR